MGNLNVVDIIPNIASAESEQNSEPSLAVDPFDPRQMIDRRDIRFRHPLF
jgi:hypothetical protein